MTKRTTILFMCVMSLVSLVGCSKRIQSSSTSSPSSELTSQKLEIEKADLQPLTGNSIPNANELIEAYNNRNYGSPGWRQVLMELVTDNRVTSNFLVVNLWQNFGNEKRMLFLLQEPDGLKGASYLLNENTQSSNEMQVHLFLPAGERKVLEVARGSFDEGLLGSDFTYNDMRMLMPLKNWTYRVTGKTRLVDVPAWVLDAVPSNTSNEGNEWSKIRLYLASDFQLLLGADFFANDEGTTGEVHLRKQMRVQEFKQDNGVWSATKMVMARSPQRFTLLTLKDARFSSASIDPKLFSPDRLPFIAEKIRAGWSPE